LSGLEVSFGFGSLGLDLGDLDGGEDLGEVKLGFVRGEGVVGVAGVDGSDRSSLRWSCDQ
jgi:hypothetical protein